MGPRRGGQSHRTHPQETCRAMERPPHPVSMRNTVATVHWWCSPIDHAQQRVAGQATAQWRILPAPGGWVAGWVRSPKKVCAPKIALQFRAPLINFNFFLRNDFRMWVVGGGWVTRRSPGCHSPPPSTVALCRGLLQALQSIATLRRGTEPPPPPTTKNWAPRARPKRHRRASEIAQKSVFHCKIKQMGFTAFPPKSLF